MSTFEWVKPLQHILNSKVQLLTVSVSEWNKESENENGSAHSAKIQAGSWIRKEDKLWMIVEQAGDHLTVLELGRNDLSEKEMELIGWTMQLAQANKEKVASVVSNASESERLAHRLGEWLNKQLEADEPSYSLPDHLTVGSRLYHEMIPFLLITEHTNARQEVYPELEKLLRSFLSDDILLIPLKSQEWMIWGPISLLKDEDSELQSDHGEEETLEDSLTSIAYGLHEMLASEWLGECHLAVMHPVSPSKGMVEAAIMLRETINLGRKFHVGTNIHLPWMLQLERLLNAIPESNRSKYLEQSLKRADLFVEPEMLGTLETFFSLDCNVSETAKKLYIHRNTLLYRLDKLKHETGLDVRQFRDAVLVKIILLLYKVTKRN